MALKSQLEIIGISVMAMILAASPPTIKGSDRSGLNLRRLDSDRVLKAANRYLRDPPITITDFHHKHGPRNPHEYYSQGDYWWPNPKDPSGPYIKRDGYSNPANFVADREALIHFSIHTAALTAAYLITHDKRYAEKAIQNINAWFIDKATLMNPNLKYSQAVHGRAKGRSYGIIDTVHLVEVARSAQILERHKLLIGADKKAVNAWFTKYLHWLTTSPMGITEMNAKNNHGTCWVMQVAEFAKLTGDQKLLHFCRMRFKKVLLPDQMAANGSFPLELARTKPYGYSLFNLDAMCTVCWILSTPNDNLWKYSTPDGRNMKLALKFMYPYIKNKAKWPYQHDVEYWSDWPVRSPSLLFGGLAYKIPKYIRLWKTLNANPTVPEILRNLPIRQPVLWVH